MIHIEIKPTYKNLNIHNQEIQIKTDKDTAYRIFIDNQNRILFHKISLSGDMENRQLTIYPDSENSIILK